jgi:hypothetical protein
MLALQLRAAIEAAPRDRLSELSRALWQAFTAGAVTEVEAEELSALIEARKAVPAAPAVPRKPVGSRPRTDASLERRRRWAASGRLSPRLASHFTLAEQAVLSVVAVEVVKRGCCALALDHIASMAGVCRATVRNALKQARVLGLITVEERRQSRWRNLPNLVRIVSKEWLGWLQLGRRSDAPGGGRKSVSGTSTRDLQKGRQRLAEAPQKAAEGRGATRGYQEAGQPELRERRESGNARKPAY